ncbi:MAG TPA: hypothetical protein VKB09_00575 [Thermomicrobiales bacterium]|nr:hypothetical protein [Thermomicrobiales bacterium]
MRQLSLLAILFFALLAAVSLNRSPGTAAQDGTPGAAEVSMEGHPILGTWIVDDPNGSPSLTSFTADGVVIDVETSGGTALGAWRPTGDRTAELTMVIVIAAPEFSATIQIKATAEVDETGNSGTADYSYTAVLPDGSVTITRLPIQGLHAEGTPISNFPTWNPNQEGEGTPEATPSA